MKRLIVLAVAIVGIGAGCTQKETVYVPQSPSYDPDEGYWAQRRQQQELVDAVLDELPQRDCYVPSGCNF